MPPHTWLCCRSQVLQAEPNLDQALAQAAACPANVVLTNTLKLNDLTGGDCNWLAICQAGAAHLVAADAHLSMYTSA